MQCLPGVKSYTEVLDSFLTRLGLLKRSSIQASSVASKPPRFWYLYFAFADVTSAPEAKMCSLRISERVQLSRSKLFKLQPIVLKVKQWLRIQTNQQYKMYLYKIKYEKPIKKKNNKTHTYPDVTVAMQLPKMQLQIVQILWGLHLHPKPLLNL